MFTVSTSKHVASTNDVAGHTPETWRGKWVDLVNMVAQRNYIFKLKFKCRVISPTFLSKLCRNVWSCNSICQGLSTPLIPLEALWTIFMNANVPVLWMLPLFFNVYTSLIKCDVPGWNVALYCWHDFALRWSGASTVCALSAFIKVFWHPLVICILPVLLNCLFNSTWMVWNPNQTLASLCLTFKPGFYFWHLPWCDKTERSYCLSRVGCVSGWPQLN